MTTLREMKEALDQGEDIMPVWQPWETDISDMVCIHKTGDVYVYDPPEPYLPPTLYPDFESLIEGTMIWNWDTGEEEDVAFVEDPQQWAILEPSATDEEELEIDQRTVEEFTQDEAYKAACATFEYKNPHPVTYSEVRDYYITMYRRLIWWAQLKGENSAYWSQALTDFCRVNPEQEEEV